MISFIFLFYYGKSTIYRPGSYTADLRPDSGVLTIEFFQIKKGLIIFNNPSYFEGEIYNEDNPEVKKELFLFPQTYFYEISSTDKILISLKKDETENRQLSFSILDLPTKCESYDVYVLSGETDLTFNTQSNTQDITQHCLYVSSPNILSFNTDAEGSHSYMPVVHEPDDTEYFTLPYESKAAFIVYSAKKDFNIFVKLSEKQEVEGTTYLNQFKYGPKTQIMTLQTSQNDNCQESIIKGRISKDNLPNGLNILEIPESDVITVEIPKDKFVLFHNPTAFYIYYSLHYGSGSITTGELSSKKYFLENIDKQIITFTVKRIGTDEKLYLTVMDNISSLNNSYHDAYIGTGLQTKPITISGDQTTSKIPSNIPQNTTFYVASQSKVKYVISYADIPSDLSVKICDNDYSLITELNGKTETTYEGNNFILVYEKKSHTPVSSSFYISIKIDSIIEESADQYSFVDNLFRGTNPIFSDIQYYNPNDYSVEITKDQPLSMTLLNSFKIVMHNPYYFLINTDPQNTEKPKISQTISYMPSKSSFIEISLNENSLSDLNTNSVTLYFSIIHYDNDIVGKEASIYSGSDTFYFADISNDKANSTIRKNDYITFILTSPNLINYSFFYSNTFSEELPINIYKLDGTLLDTFSNGFSTKNYNEKSIILSYKTETPVYEFSSAISFGISNTEINQPNEHSDIYLFNEQNIDTIHILPGDYVFTFSTIVTSFSLPIYYVVIMHNITDNIKVEYDRYINDQMNYYKNNSLFYCDHATFLNFSTKSGTQKVAFTVVKSYDEWDDNDYFPAVVIGTEGAYVNIGNRENCRFDFDQLYTYYIYGFNIILSSVNVMNYSFFSDSTYQKRKVIVADENGKAITVLNNENGKTNFNILAKTIQLIQNIERDTYESEDYVIGFRPLKIIQNNEVEGSNYLRTVDYSMLKYLRDSEVTGQFTPYGEFTETYHCYISYGTYSMYISPDIKVNYWFEQHSTVVFYNPSLFEARSNAGSDEDEINILGETKYVVVDSINNFSVTGLHSISGFQKCRFSVSNQPPTSFGDYRDIAFINDGSLTISQKDFQPQSDKSFSVLLATPYKSFFTADYTEERGQIAMYHEDFSSNKPFINNYVTVFVEARSYVSNTAEFQFNNVPIYTHSIPEEEKEFLLDFGTITLSKVPSLVDSSYSGILSSSKDVYYMLSHTKEINLDHLTTPIILAIVFAVLVVIIIIIALVCLIIQKRKKKINSLNQSQVSFAMMNANSDNKNANEEELKLAELDQKNIQQQQQQPSTNQIENPYVDDQNNVYNQETIENPNNNNNFDGNSYPNPYKDLE